jgi:enterochelin esterase-like enzyme
MRETILIGVDGNGPIYRFSEWANSFDGHQRMEDALVQDLVPFIDQHYRTLTDAADRTIGGLSMGGYGAVNIALHHPEVFRGVMSVGGYFQAEGPVFGSGSGRDTYRQFNSPSFLLQTPTGKRAASSMLFVIGVGTTDGRYYHEGGALYEQLRKMAVRVHLLTAVGGHSWPLWARQLGEALPLLEPLPLSARAHLVFRQRAARFSLLNPFALF